MRELLGQLRPGPRDGGAGPPAAVAAALDAAMSLTTPNGAEARQHFLSGGGVLVLLELLDTDGQKVRALSV